MGNGIAFANYPDVPISTVRPALSDNAAIAIDHPLMARHGVLTDAVGKGECACVFQIDRHQPDGMESESG